MSFQRYVCWNQEDADKILRTEALEGSRAVFMATHVPIAGFEVQGHRAAWVGSPTDTGLLEALERPDLRHALCVVEGEPGSGKSHLIRWLYFNWPQSERDLVVLVQRREGSLEGALRSLRERLPSDLQRLFAGLGEVKTTSLEGRALDFQSKLAHSFQRGYFTEELPVHADWAEGHQVSQLMDPPMIRGEWKAPRRILNILSGMKGERNSLTAEFTLEDVLEFTGLLRRVKEFGPKATRFKLRLLTEADRLRARLEQGASAEDIGREFDENSELKRLVEALNARLNHAVQDLLGISGQTLKNAFMKLREELARPERNQRLVLLFEDITSMQGVQDQLMDVMIASSETEENRTLSDLITIVGVTPHFFDKLFNASNLRQRISLHLKFGRKEGVFQEIYAMRTPEERLLFASRYLRAVRSGVKEIEQVNPVDSSAVPNSCDSCPHVTTCHPTFGAFKGVGLYPFTERAINQLYEGLHESRGQATLRTPRGMIQGVLVPAMLKPSALEQGEFPPPDVENQFVPTRDLTGLAGPIIAAQAGGDEQLVGRLRRLIAWWGDRDSGKTLARQDGTLEFAGVARGVFDAFDLPWPGASAGQGTTAPVTTPAPVAPQPQPELTSRPEKPQVKGPKPSVPVQPESPGKEPSTPKVVKAPKIPRVQTSAALQLRKDQLTNWFKGELIADQTFWKKQLSGLMRSIPWRSLGISSWIQHKLFTEETLLLSGTGKADVRHMVLPREKWVKEGLQAFVVLSAKGELTDKAELEFNRRSLARMLRKLSPAVLEHARKRIPSTESGAEWSPAGSAAQVLLVRAWLRGTISPDAPAHEQWNAVVRDETELPESSQPRVDTWGEVVVRTGHAHGGMRDTLRHLLNLPQDPFSQEISFYDAGGVASAVLGIIRTLRFDPMPANDSGFTKVTAALEKVMEYARHAEERLQPLVRYERERLLNRSAEVEQACRGLALPEYLLRVETTVTKLAQTDRARMPSAPVTACHKALGELSKRGLREDREGTAARKLDGFLAELDPERRQQLENASLPEALAWALRAPAAELAICIDQVRMIEGALTDLHTYVKGRLQLAGTPSGVSLAVVESAVTRFVSAVDSIRAALPTGVNRG